MKMDIIKLVEMQLEIQFQNLPHLILFIIEQVIIN